ncbi:MAG: hypothetical protein ACAF41_23830 [Leptolyngbya sp. BL-A-14]
MDRQQHQHRSRQPQPSKPVRSGQQVRQAKARWGLSLVLLGSAWVVVVVVALTALSGLLSPDLSTNQPSRTASIRATPTAPVSGQSRLPLWLFGAIALSCVAGSMLLSAQANRPPRPRKSVRPKRLISHRAPETTALSFSDSENLPSQPILDAPGVAMAPHPPQPNLAATPFMAPATLMQLAQHARSVEQPTGGATAIPPENTSPVDWGEASLADKLDIRKQRSISSLL